jgi:hypothetical protein
MEFLPVDAPEVEWLRDHDLHYRGPGGCFASYAPAIFERYLRILHPAQIHVGGDCQDVSWHEIAAAAGKPLVATSSYGDFLDVKDLPGFERLAGPLESELGDRQCDQLVAVLGGSNTDPDGCIVGFAEWWASMLPESPVLRSVPFDCATYLFAACSFSQIGRFVSPTFWWTKERSWIVVTPPDSLSSFIGCGASTAAAVQAAGVETLEVGPEDEVLFWR